jgi:hypothetical protein
LNVHAPTENKSDNTKVTFYKELEHVFDQLLKYHVKILLGYFDAKAEREHKCKPTTGNEILHGVTVVNLATSKKCVKSIVFPHHNIHKYTWTSPDGKMHNQTEHVLINKNSIQV